MNLAPYIRASYPILWLQTAEESRAELQVLETALEVKRNLRVWSHTEGFFSPDPKNPDRDATEDPIEALKTIKADPKQKTIYVFRDLHPYFSAPKVVRLLRDIAQLFKQTEKTLIIISPLNKIPPELERDITLIEFELPNKSEIAHTFDSLYNTNKKGIGEIEEDERDRIIQAAMGLTTTEAESAFAKAIVERSINQKKGEEVLPVSSLVLTEKAQAVRKTGILEYFEARETTDDIGGLDNLKKWLGIRSNAFSKKAREFGLPMPRGILLAGLPGCGKSLSAKATSNILNVPLIRLDVGRVFGSLVGESEQNMRTAIQTVEAVGNCILWIDEMEKAFAGMMNSSSGDSGTSQRVFGNFITWMQENDKPVFIVATVNRIEGLPPELLRKGRFDEIFFVGLPTISEREDILKIHIGRYGRDPEKFDLKECAEQSVEFSGAELEFSVVTGLYNAFHNDRELNANDILEAINGTNPLAVSKKDALEYMRRWASENAVNASSSPPDETADGDAVSAGRQLELTE